MPTNQNGFRNQLIKIISRWLTLSHRHQEATDAMAVAQHRMNCILPQVLLDFYEVIYGTCIMDVFNRFFSPSEFRLDGDKIIFAEENQAVVQWAINRQIRGEEYVVYQRQEGGVWNEEASPLDEFLLQMLILQLTNGALSFSGFAELPDAVFVLFDKDLTRVFTSDRRSEFDAFETEDVLLCVVGGFGSRQLICASNSSLPIRDLGNRYSLDIMISDNDEITRSNSGAR